MISFQTQHKFNQDGTIILISEEQCKDKNFNFTHAALKANILNFINSKQFNGKEGEVFLLLHEHKPVVVAGIGTLKEVSLTALRICVRNTFLSSFCKSLSTFELILPTNTDEIITSVIEGVCLGTYSWNKYKHLEIQKNLKVVIIAQKKKIYTDTFSICEGVNFTRDLVNENADVTNSVFLEKTIKDLIKNQKNITTEILNQKQLEAKGLGLHLAVNQGSANEPRLIIVQYQGASKDSPYTALVGKGLTFDTGGLNLKPTGGIESMKLDMGGAAAVIGTLKNTIALKPNKNILFVCGIAENVTGSKSYKPGAVLTGYAGKTVEVANTDAEGRLVLADAIAYVTKNYKPDTLIDIATLTGACIVALGNDYTGLVSTNDKLADKLLLSSRITDDRTWRLPSYPELKTSVKSQIADIRNTGFPKGAGGMITAAEFLRQFADKKTSWAHLDIAGTSYVEGDSRMYFGHGATGSGVRLLTHFLCTN